jgi:hypothetical protein
MSRCASGFRADAMWRQVEAVRQYDASRARSGSALSERGSRYMRSRTCQPQTREKTGIESTPSVRRRLLCGAICASGARPWRCKKEPIRHSEWARYGPTTRGLIDRGRRGGRRRHGRRGRRPDRCRREARACACLLGGGASRRHSGVGACARCPRRVCGRSSTNTGRSTPTPAPRCTAAKAGPARSIPRRLHIGRMTPK